MCGDLSIALVLRMASSPMLAVPVLGSASGSVPICYIAGETDHFQHVRNLDFA
jgi:hypothetical protein